MSILRGGAVAARRAHNPEVAGSSPAPATKHLPPKRSRCTYNCKQVPHTMDDATRKAVLGEALMDELKAIREYVQDTPGMKQELREVKIAVDDFRADVHVVKAVARDHEAELRILKR